MYNHARTLLVNLTGSVGFISNAPGEELIPFDYVQLTLPGYINSIRSRLFGANPDRAMLNYRIAQLLQLIATTELQEYIVALDSRITYQLNKLNLAADKMFEPKVNKYAGLASDVLTLVGNAASPDVSGQSGYNFQIKIVSNSGIKAQISRLTFPLQEEEEPLSLTSGLSPEFNLPFSSYKFRVNTVNIGSAWTISGFLRPTATLSELMENIKSIGEPALISLFGASPQEPYTTFKNCWQYHQDFAYRFSGFLLALIYRIEEIRNG
jgi:hypothetical protein